MYKFKIGTTSFVKWDNWQENILFLKDEVEFIEILTLEDTYAGDLPTSEDIKEIKKYKDEFQLQYTLHLPYKIQLASQDESKRKSSVDRVKKVLNLVEPLEPNHYILHTYLYDHQGPEILEKSKEALHRSLLELRPLFSNSRLMGIETLTFNFENIFPLVEEFDTSIILDIGQCIKYKKPYFEYLQKYFDRIVDIHIHGFLGSKDHESLLHFDRAELLKILNYLIENKYNKHLTIEVFSENNFNESINLLKEVLNGK